MKNLYICRQFKVINMKKSLSIIVLMASLMMTSHLSLSAQDGKVANKVLYNELGGPGLIMSANFDSRFNSNSQLGVGFRVGIGFAYGEFRDDKPNEWGYYGSVTRTYYSIPVGLNYIFGKPNSSHTFEVGTGLSFLTRKVSLFTYDYDGNSGNVIGFFSFMYRRIPKDGGFSWRIGFTPIVGTSGDLVPMGAVGIGYGF